MCCVEEGELKELDGSYIERVLRGHELEIRSLALEASRHVLTPDFLSTPTSPLP
jgi:hypothetical protein